MTLTPLTILYLALSVAVLGVGGLLSVVLWQVSSTIAQARGVLLPEILLILRKAAKNLENTDHITDDIQGKLDKLDPALTSTSKAVEALSETALLANRMLAQPAILRLATFTAGIKGAWLYLAERRAKLGVEEHAPGEPEGVPAAAQEV